MIASSAIAAAPAGASALQINDLGLANAQNVAGFYWTAVNDSDQVSGSEPAGPNKFQAARWSNGTASLLGTLGPYSSGGSGITNAGTVLGYRGDDLGSGLGIYPTLWDLAGNQQELPAYPGGENGGFLAVAKNGTAVLTDDSAPVNNNHAVIAQPPYTTVVKTPGFNPTSVNTSAHAVGTSDGGVHEYWNGSAAVPVQVAVNSGFITSTHALNDADQVIGNTTAGLAAVQQEPSGALTTLPEVPGAPRATSSPRRSTMAAWSSVTPPPARRSGRPGRRRNCWIPCCPRDRAGTSSRPSTSMSAGTSSAPEPSTARPIGTS